MLGKGARVLVVEDDPDQGALVVADLENWGFAPVWVQNVEDARSELEANEFQAVLSDINLAEPRGGIELCRETLAKYPDLPVLLMTAYGDLGVAVEALRAGAYDLLAKPFSGEELIHRLARTIELRRLRSEVVRLRHENADIGNLEIVGESSPMLAIKRLVNRVAQVETSVLITGESGTGKEMVARSIHKGSARAKGPFVPINCAALPAGLLESDDTE